MCNIQSNIFFLSLISIRRSSVNNTFKKSDTTMMLQYLIFIYFLRFDSLGVTFTSILITTIIEDSDEEYLETSCTFTDLSNEQKPKRNL